MNEELAARIAESLERLTNAAEALVLMAQVFVSEEEDVPQKNVIMTQSGPVEFR